MPRWPVVLPSLLLVGCFATRVVSDLREQSPPPELGRPEWVRLPTRAGAVLGAGAGAIASIVLLPITWPITWLADEPLGQAEGEFLFLPVSVGAASGHFLVGAPLDGLDFVFRRAWITRERPTGYDYTPAPAPVGPTGSADRAAGER